MLKIDMNILTDALEVFLNLKSHICLIGDFNSKTSDKDEFILLDIISNHKFDLDDPDLDCLSNTF